MPSFYVRKVKLLSEVTQLNIEKKQTAFLHLRHTGSFSTGWSLQVYATKNYQEAKANSNGDYSNGDYYCNVKTKFTLVFLVSILDRKKQRHTLDFGYKDKSFHSSFSDMYPN